MKYAIPVLVGVALVVFGCMDGPVAPDLQVPDGVTATELEAASKATVDRAEYAVQGYPFQFAGPPGDDGVLEEGSTWPPTKGSSAKLLRGKDFLQLNAHTTGLPPGAYTVWWGLINKPEMCAVPGACDIPDVFNPVTEGSVFWATGGIVQANGVGNFSARVYVGELPQGDDQIMLAGNGLTNPQEAVVFSVIKYHGPPSDDPYELWLQTHTLTGLCTTRANAYDVMSCFDPQLAIIR